MTSLYDALQNVRAPTQRLNQQEVWCLLRLDGNDSTIETFWSESRVTSYIHVPKQPLYNEIGPPSRTTGIPGGYKRTTEQVAGLPGRHAEQVLCNKFAGILNKYGQVPQIVEIFLSDSPCLNQSQAEGGFPQGCTNKLLHLVTTHSAIPRWIIHYEKTYVGHGPADLLASQQAISQLKNHPKIEVGKIDSALL